MKISFIKKFKLFLTYIKIIKKFRQEITNQFNLRIDKSYRLYTVINIPKDYIEEPYTLRKSDYDTISESLIKDFTNKLSFFLNSKGLNELYDIYDITRIDNNSYLLIYGFSLFKSNKVIFNFYKFIGFFILLSTIFILFKTFIH